MAVIVAPGVQSSPSLPSADDLLRVLSGRLTLADVADSPDQARYAVASVDAANMPMLQGVQPVAGLPWPSSAGVTQFNGRVGNVTVNQLAGTGPVYGVGVSTPGSGIQVGDYRNIPATLTAGVRSVLSTSPLTYSIVGSAGPYTIDFNCAAVSVYNAGITTSYNAAVTVNTTQAASTTVTYYLYYSDPTYAGGTQALQFTTSPQTLSQAPGIVNLGNCSVTTPSSGTGGGGGGSGGGGYCITEEMWVREGLMARDAKPGSLFDCLDIPSAQGIHQRPLLSFERALEECVRLRTQDGCELDCSTSTPFDLLGGGSAKAPDMQGKLVVTDRGISPVIHIEPLGVHGVIRCHLGGVSFAAGREPRARIYSHNAFEKP